MIALLGAIVTLLAAPASAPGWPTRGMLPPPGAPAIPDPTSPARDTLILSADSRARKAVASAVRYPVNDGEGRSVSISVSALCSVLCTGADPQSIATFLGTVAHSNEMSLLNVELVTPTPGEIATRCGPQALACYYPGLDLILISGNDDTASDGATREFIVAHEYGHHLANHRRNPPFEPALDYGPKRWATYERICEGARSGVYRPGNQGLGYRQNPGEAFAEAFAFNRFPDAPVEWAWIDSLKPTATAFNAIRRDALVPWAGKTRLPRQGRIADVGRRGKIHRFATPLDGELKVRLSGSPGSDLELLLRNRQGKTVAVSRGIGSREFVNFTVCGDSAMRAVVQRDADAGGRYRLAIFRP